MCAWYAYLLRCSDGTLYCGSTTDLKRRIQEHNSGKGAKYTRGRTPVKLIGFKGFESRSDAQSFEASVKALPKKEKIGQFYKWFGPGTMEDKHSQ